MSIIILLISISLTIALAFLGAFIWSMKSGQLDDLYGPSIRILFEEKKKSDVKKQKDDTGKTTSSLYRAKAKTL